MYVFDDNRCELLKNFYNFVFRKGLSNSTYDIFLVDFGTRFILDEFLVFIPKECP